MHHASSRPHLREDVLEAMHAALRQLAERGDLAAKDVKQRRIVGFIEVEYVIAGDGGRVTLAVVEQRAHTGEGM